MGKEKLITLAVTREEFAELDKLVQLALAENCLRFCAATRAHPLDMTLAQKVAFDKLRDETATLQSIACVFTSARISL